MNRLLKVIFALTAVLCASLSSSSAQLIDSNSCVQFSVSQGTGCAWMCNYCADQLGTNNYYFTDNVCTYEQDQGCVGNPIAGKQYTCCSAGQEKREKNKNKKKDKKKMKGEKDNKVCKQF